MNRLQEERAAFTPPLPPVLRGGVKLCAVEEGSVDPRIAPLFPKSAAQPHLRFAPGDEEKKPLRIGVVLSGGQAPGGHNVIVGLSEALFSGSTLIGFLNGPGGILEGRHEELTDLRAFRNSGGFDLIGSGRTKIEGEEALARALEVVNELSLDGVVIIGGDDSNTNAAILAEYLLAHGSQTVVVGVPKTIDGDLKNSYVETSFGFDTAAKVYSEMIGNLCRDALSARKYTHFVKLMGRSASHLTLECALQTHPNFTIISEEVAAREISLDQIVTALVDLIVQRKGRDFGVVLIPEGLLECIPEMRTLIEELNAQALLSAKSQSRFDALPKPIQEQLMLDRDPHGNVQLSHIETEKLLIELVKERLHKRSDYSGTFQPVAHFFGYEGRCSYPSNFDATYCYALGVVAHKLIAQRKSGYLCTIKNLASPVEEWEPGALPIVQLMHLEERKGREKAVIAKSLVDLEGAPFRTFLEERNRWGMEDDYHFPGPLQLFGPSAVCNAITQTLMLEQHKKAEV